MATYIFTWNPTDFSWDGFDQDRIAVEAGRTDLSYGDWWSTGTRTHFNSGERFFLLQQHANRGIIGSGFTTSGGYKDDHYCKPDRKANYVHVRFDHLLPTIDRLPSETLLRVVPDLQWHGLRAGGIRINRATDAATLEELWRTHLEGIGRLAPPLAEEIVHASQFVEGATCEITINAYERNAKARRACLDHYGFDCSVCEFNFQQKYGDIGEEYIHVHHLRDLATIAERYEVDPIEDLRPVCPNCHAMLHTERPAMSIERLRKIIKM
jgi:5-methylcytosine-specific restriction enzyme A